MDPLIKSQLLAGSVFSTGRMPGVRVAEAYLVLVKALNRRELPLPPADVIRRTAQRVGIQMSITSRGSGLRVAKQLSHTAIFTFAELSGNRADERRLRRESVIPASSTLSDQR